MRAQCSLCNVCTVLVMTAKDTRATSAWGGGFKHLHVCFLTCIVWWRHNKNEPKITRKEMTTNCRLHGRLNCVLLFLVKRDRTWHRSSFQHSENRYKWQMTKSGQKCIRMFCLWSHHPGQWLGLTQAGRLPERTYQVPVVLTGLQNLVVSSLQVLA